MVICTNLLSQSIKKFSESSSTFNDPPVLMNNNYLITQLYRVYKKGSTGFSSMNSLRNSLENKIRQFAINEKKVFVILEQKNTNPPFL